MLDIALREAIQEVVAEAGQPEAVSKRLIAWLTHLGAGDVGRDENNTFLGNVRDALVLGELDED